MRRIGFVATALFVLTIWFANWLISRYGPVPVGFGLLAPAGVYAAGLAFTLRDIVHRTLGRWFVMVAILAGALLSYLISPAFAVASAVAFLASEVCDMAVYEPLARRSFLGGVFASNVVGAVVDSLIFLWLAFHSLEFLTGQVVGKLWMTAAALPLLLASQRYLVPHERQP